MTNTELLEMTKANLQMASSAFDTYLENLIDVARASISEYGITIDDSEVKDCNLIVMYASYLFSKRRSENSEMPRMLAQAMRNRLFSEKMRGD